MPEIVTRKDAKARSLLHYFTGKACPKGHVCERTLSDRKCCECYRERDRTPERKAYEGKRNQSPERQEYMRAYLAAYRAARMGRQSATPTRPADARATQG
jgi:hypothetical protein